MPLLVKPPLTVRLLVFDASKVPLIVRVPSIDTVGSLVFKSKVPAVMVKLPVKNESVPAAAVNVLDALFKITFLNVMAGIVTPVVAAGVKETVPRGLNVPFAVITVPLPVIVRVLDTSENVCEASIIKLVNVIFEPIFSVVLPLFAETWIMPKSLFAAALSVTVWVLPPPTAKMILLAALLVTTPLAVTVKLPRNVISDAGSVSVPFKFKLE